MCNIKRINEMQFKQKLSIVTANIPFAIFYTFIYIIHIYYILYIYIYYTYFIPLYFCIFQLSINVQECLQSVDHESLEIPMFIKYSHKLHLVVNFQTFSLHDTRISMRRIRNANINKFSAIRSWWSL